MSSIAFFGVLIKLFLAHAIADFALQPHKWVKVKTKHKIRSVYLYIHVLIHGILTYILIGDWTSFLLPFLVMIIHFGIDVFKLYRAKNFKWFLIDQGLHLVSLFLLWMFFYEQATSVIHYLKDLFSNTTFWMTILAYVLILHPTSTIIYQATEKWQKVISEAEGKGLKNAGKWIGMIERVLILTFIIAGHFTAVGFLLGAKSIFRFGDLTGKKDRKLTEYVLIGTLLSFSITIILGLILNSFLQ